MLVGRGEETIDFDLRINLTGKLFKFAAVHFLAVIFIKPALQTRDLCRAVGHGKDDFIFLFFNFIADNDRPGIEAQCLDKPFQTFLSDIEAFQNCPLPPCCQPGTIPFR